MKVTKRQLRRIIKESLQLEMFSTSSADPDVGMTSSASTKLSAPLGQYAVYKGGRQPVAFHSSVVDKLAAEHMQMVRSAEDAAQIVGNKDLVFWSGSHSSFTSGKAAQFVKTAVQAAVDDMVITAEYEDELMERFMEQGGWQFQPKEG